MIGQSIAHYKITAKLGEGGMGEVWRATDQKLGREVALKILPESFARDPERMARFQREAHVLASLNHPNIAAIYGVEERALVLELVEGPTLGDRIRNGSLPLDQTLKIARQVADALEYAHDKGVVHRDLKPANVKVTPEGVVKVLDFGLAKIAEEPPPPGADPDNSPTLTLAATRMGVIIGTAAYMAPEQASGLPVDKRADIWSFGVVLWEMLAGGRMFSGQTVSHTLAAVLTKDFDWNRIPASTPAPIRHILRRCLEREVKNRLRDIGEARVAIGEQLSHPAQEIETKPALVANRPRWALGAAALAALAVASAAALAVIHFSEKTAVQNIVRFPVAPPPGMTFETWDLPSISPDGQKLVFGGPGADGKRFLWLRAMDSQDLVQLAGTENAYFPFWSPDSRSVAFFAQEKLKRMDMPGGPPVTICDAPGNSSGGSWSRDGVIVFGRRRALYQVPAGGGDPKALLEPDKSRKEQYLAWPWFLPDGKHFLYLAGNSETGKSMIQVGSLGSKEVKAVMPAESNAMYSAAGFLLFNRQESLMARPFDAANLEFKGDPFPVAERLGAIAVLPGVAYAISENGVLVYRGGGRNEAQLTWFNREGRRLGTVGERGEYRQFVLSPDDKRVALERYDPKTNTRDLWLLDLATGIFSRFTSDPSNDQDAVWSPDSRALAFTSNRKGSADLYKKVIGESEETLLLASPEPKFSEDWLADGSIIYDSPTGGRNIFRLPPASPAKPVLLYQDGFVKDEPKVSPDGRWISYASNETGRWEVYAAAFPSFAQRRQVSSGSGCGPHWRKDGRELYYMSMDGKLMAVDVKAGAALETGTPKLLFQTSVKPDGRLDLFSVTSDGQRFLYAEPVEQEAAPIQVVLNWHAGVKRP